MNTKVKVCPLTGKEFVAVGKQKYSEEGKVIAARNSRNKYNDAHGIVPKSKSVGVTKAKEPVVRICEVTGQPFLAIGRQRISAEGSRINRCMEAKRLRDKNKKNPKWVARQAELARKRRLDKRDAGPEVSSSRAYHNNYMGGYRQLPEQKEYRHNYYLSTQFKARESITEDKKKELLAYQGFKCGIFQQPITMENGQLDHCPVTGRIRGYLTPQANTGIGFAHHNPHLLRTLADQLDDGTINRNNRRFNNILGRISDSKSLRLAADYIENPPYNAIRDLPANNNEVQLTNAEVQAA
jgi:Recombination endonuclease VII